jgi:hypothetical protein
MKNGVVVDFNYSNTSFKQFIMKRFFEIKSAVLLLILSLSSNMLFAQDSTVTTILTSDEELWYMQPWVWIVGGVALLLILIALFSGGRKNKAGSRTDKVIITKTVRTETDVDD